MLLSIVIPVYNVEKYIEKCLKSCLEQDINYSDYEVIIVNDGSPDNSMEVVEPFLFKYNNIKVVQRDNGGLSAARNTGIDNASGEYIMFLDSDDWIENNSLSKVKIALLKYKPDILMICACDEINGEMIRRQKYERLDITTGVEVLKNRIPPCAPFSIVRRNLLSQFKLHFYEGIYHEDSEFTPRLFYYAKKVAKINDIIYCVYQNPDSITRTNNPKKAYDVVGIVCPSLHTFSKDKDREYQAVINNRISMDINTALSNFDTSKIENVRCLNSLFYKNRYLFKHFIKSDYMKYRIEGLLFSIFPSHVVQVYQLLQKVKS